MEKNTETRSKIVKIVIGAIVVVGLLATMHILINNFHIVSVLKAMHGG